MIRSTARKSIAFFCGLLLLVAGLELWRFLVHDDETAGLSARISLLGEAAYPITPDSIAADPLDAPAPSFASFSLTVRISSAIDPGGSIRIEQGCIFNGRPLIGADIRYAFPDPVIHDATLPNYLSAETDGAACRLILSPTGLGRFAPETVFPEGLAKETAVTFRFGDRSQGSPGMAVPTFPLKIRLLPFVSLGLEKEHRLAAGDYPSIEAYASGADRIGLFAPSVAPGRQIEVRIVPLRGAAGLRSSSLPVSDFEGVVAVYGDEEGEELLGTASFVRGDRHQRLKITVPAGRGGIHRLFALAAQGALKGESNPILVPEEIEAFDARSLLEDRLVFWGSLQNHTAVGGHAASTPDEAFRCARGEGALDFCALTDHSSNESFQWSELRELPDRFNDPGRFVAFAGYEWTSSQYGHRHVIVKDGRGTFACTELPGSDVWEKYAPDLKTLAALAGHDPNVLLIPHHTKRVLGQSPSPFDFGPVDALPRQRLFEVYSWQGSSEGSDDDLPINGRPDRTIPSGSGFRDALKRGMRFGVTADSDAHLGLPGVSVAIERTMGLRYGLSGLTAVFASRLDRTPLFESLEERRCYGTTGARIVLLFKAGQACMGREIEWGEGKIPVSIVALGTAPIRSLQIVADGEKMLYETHPRQRDVVLSLDLDPPRSSAGTSLYVRIVQDDGQMAWSSPIWLDRP